MNYNHIPVKLQELTTETINRKRFYVTPEGNKYPSITTVLGWFSAKSIAQWRKRVGSEAANKITTQASRRGTSVHQLCEDYLNNIEIDYKKNTRRINGLKIKLEDAELEFIPGRVFYMQGLGYTHPEWGHGNNHGKLAVSYTHLTLPTNREV